MIARDEAPVITNRSATIVFIDSLGNMDTMSLEDYVKTHPQYRKTGRSTTVSKAY
jgi:hypothetical protein